MITGLTLFVILMDLVILMVTLSGFGYTIYKIRKKKFKLIARDYGLLAMYFTYLMFTLLSFMVEYSIYIHAGIKMPREILAWIIVKRFVQMLFTIIAIAWSSGYKFGGTQSSGI